MRIFSIFRSLSDRGINFLSNIRRIRYEGRAGVAAYVLASLLYVLRWVIISDSILMQRVNVNSKIFS